MAVHSSKRFGNSTADRLEEDVKWFVIWVSKAAEPNGSFWFWARFGLQSGQQLIQQLGNAGSWLILPDWTMDKHQRIEERETCRCRLWRSRVGRLKDAQRPNKCGKYDGRSDRRIVAHLKASIWFVVDARSSSLIAIHFLCVYSVWFRKVCFLLLFAHRQQ